MRSIEKTGKKTEDAINAGLKELGCDLADVTIDILDAGSPGLFGMFGRLAKVRLTVKEDDPELDFEMPTLSLNAQKTKPARKSEAPRKEEAPRTEKPAPKAEAPVKAEETAEPEAAEPAEAPAKAEKTEKTEKPEKSERSSRRGGRRERAEKAPKYRELCRRFLADCEDFSEEKIAEAGITRRFQNDDLKRCRQEIEEYLAEMM